MLGYFGIALSSWGAKEVDHLQEIVVSGLDGTVTVKDSYWDRSWGESVRIAANIKAVYPFQVSEGMPHKVTLIYEGPSGEIATRVLFEIEPEHIGIVHHLYETLFDQEAVPALTP